MIMGGFVEEYFEKLDAPGRRQLEELLEVQDPVLNDWLAGNSDPPESLASIVSRIKEWKDRNLA